MALRQQSSGNTATRGRNSGQGSPAVRSVTVSSLSEGGAAVESVRREGRSELPSPKFVSISCSAFPSQDQSVGGGHRMRAAVAPYGAAKTPYWTRLRASRLRQPQDCELETCAT